jgi:hypothetical protein
VLLDLPALVLLLILLRRVTHVFVTKSKIDGSARRSSRRRVSSITVSFRAQSPIPLAQKSCLLKTIAAPMPRVDLERVTKVFPGGVNAVDGGRRRRQVQPPTPINSV